MNSNSLTLHLNDPPTRVLMLEAATDPFVVVDFGPHVSLYIELIIARALCDHLRELLEAHESATSGLEAACSRG